MPGVIYNISFNVQDLASPKLNRLNASTSKLVTTSKLASVNVRKIGIEALLSRRRIDALTRSMTKLSLAARSIPSVYLAGGGALAGAGGGGAIVGGGGGKRKGGTTAVVDGGGKGKGGKGGKRRTGIGLPHVGGGAGIFTRLAFGGIGLGQIGALAGVYAGYKILEGSIKNASEFGAGQAKLRGVSGINKSTSDIIGGQAFSIAQNTISTPKQVQDLQLALVRSGLSAQETTTITPSANKLGILAGIEPEKAGMGMVKAIKQYQLAARETRNIGDSMAYTASKTTANLEELIQALGFMGGVAKGSGIDYKQTLALIGTGVETIGRKGSPVGRTLSGALITLKKSRALKALTNRYGIDSYDEHGESNMFQTLSDIAGKMKGMKGVERDKLMNEISTIIGKRSLEPILRNWDKVMKLYMGIVGESVGWVDKALAPYQQTLEKKAKQTSSAWKAFSTVLGKNVTGPIAGDALDRTTGILKFLTGDNTHYTKQIDFLKKLTPEKLNHPLFGDMLRKGAAEIGLTKPSDFSKDNIQKRIVELKLRRREADINSSEVQSSRGGNLKMLSRFPDRNRQQIIEKIEQLYPTGTGWFQRDNRNRQKKKLYKYQHILDPSANRYEKQLRMKFGSHIGRYSMDMKEMMDYWEENEPRLHKYLSDSTDMSSLDSASVVPHLQKYSGSPSEKAGLGTMNEALKVGTGNISVENATIIINNQQATELD